MARPRLLNIKEVAEMLGMKPQSVRHYYPKWKVEYGIAVYRRNRTGHPLFKESDVINMVEKWRVA